MLIIGEARSNEVVIIEARVLLKNISIGKVTLIFQQQASLGNSSTLLIWMFQKNLGPQKLIWNQMLLANRLE